MTSDADGVGAPDDDIAAKMNALALQVWFVAPCWQDDFLLLWPPYGLSAGAKYSIRMTRKLDSSHLTDRF